MEKYLLKGREVLVKGLGVNISNGKMTHFWTDNWMPDSPLIQHSLHPLSNLEASFLVADYCDEYGTWNFTALQEILPVSKIASLWIADEDDSWFWSLEGDGRFSSKSAYLAQMQTTVSSSLPWHKVWSVSCPNKMKIFIWRI